jgi:hypothetical protein
MKHVAQELFEKGRSLLINMVWCGCRCNFYVDVLRGTLSVVLWWPAKEDGCPLRVYSQKCTTIVRVWVVTVPVTLCLWSFSDCRRRAAFTLFVLLARTSHFSEIGYQIHLHPAELSRCTSELHTVSMLLILKADCQMGAWEGL